MLMQELRRLAHKADEKPWLRRALFWGVLAAGAGLFFLFALQSRMIYDDYAYASLFGGRSFLDYLAFHYTNMNGRIVSNGIFVLFYDLPPAGFAAVQAAGYAALILLLYRIGGHTFRKLNTLWLLALQLLIWFFAPAFGEIFIWKCASLVYLFGSLLALAALLPFFTYLERKSRLSRGADAAKAIGVGILCILGGWSWEGAGTLLVAALALFLLRRRWLQKQKCPLWMWTGFAGSMLGFAALMLSPAQWKRIAGAQTGLASNGAVHGLMRSAFGVAIHCLEHLTPLLVVFCLALAAGLVVQKKKADLNKMQNSVIFLFAAAASLVILIPTGSGWGRAFAAGFFGLLLAVGAALPRLPQRGALRLRALLVAALAFPTMLFAWQYYSELRAAQDTAAAFDAREAMILQAKAAGEASVYVLPIAQQTGTHNVFGADGDISPDTPPEHWMHRWLTNYYGIEVFAAAEAEA